MADLRFNQHGQLTRPMNYERWVRGSEVESATVSSLSSLHSSVRNFLVDWLELSRASNEIVGQWAYKIKSKLAVSIVEDKRWLQSISRVMNYIQRNDFYELANTSKTVFFFYCQFLIVTLLQWNRYQVPVYWQSSFSCYEIDMIREDKLASIEVLMDRFSIQNWLEFWCTVPFC